ncbi:ABC transporter permease [Paenibacillus sp. TCA20]|uniref:ABC transporter permease n=1 Tax=Paenibacillus sp. TCA20 TaxID=1499968 RepID=UPI000A858FA4|nr:ABC transporter permease [Paenibacillus sp. TCA20]
MKTYFENFMKYRELLIQLVIRDIKVKYKNSVLGMLWSLLHPTLIMIIMTIVFSQLFKFNIDNFPVYLLSGNIIFNFFSLASSSAMNSIMANASLMGKVYIPKYIFPISKICFEFVNMLISMIALILVIFITKVPIDETVFLSFIPLAYIFIFSLGIGLLLSSVAVFFRDTIHLYSVLLTAWMYLTPLFYPIDIIPEKYILLIYLNPLYYFVECFRSTVLYMEVPSIELNLVCIGYSLTSLVLGLLIFYRKQDKFILYV